MSNSLASLKEWLTQRESELRAHESSLDAEQRHYFGPGCLWDKDDEDRYVEYNRKINEAYVRLQEIRGVLAALDRFAVHRFTEENAIARKEGLL
jgi:hypothetical protein